MAEITRSRELVSQINHIKVAPENQEELVDQMMRNLRDVVAPARGFISSTIFRSLDGKDVVNFVQWESPELLEAVHETDAFKSQLDNYRSLAIEGGPKLYSIAVSRERDPSLPSDGPLTLHVMPGSCALASHIALEWAGAEYKLDLLGHDDLSNVTFRAINPKGSVPVLSIGSDRNLTESLAILNYVADSYPDARLGGVRTGERARLNEVLAEFVSDIHHAWGPVFVPDRFAAPGQSVDDVRAIAQSRLEEKYARLDGLLGDRDWLLFDRKTVADAYLYVMCLWKGRTPTGLDPFGSLERFKERLGGDEGVGRALSEEGFS